MKARHPGALRLLGYDPEAPIHLETFTADKLVLTLGEALKLSLRLRSESPKREPVVVDYAVHHVKKNGQRGPKVFKLRTFEIGPGERSLSGVAGVRSRDR